MTEGETAPADILLDPSGERTIIAPPHRVRRPVDLKESATVDAIYVNAADCTPALHAQMIKTPLSVAQFPAREAPRPADILIGSTADLAGSDYGALWQAACRIAGERLAHFVLTDGPDPVRLMDHDEIRIVLPPERLTLSETIGAGDTFAGSYIHAILSGHAPPEAALIACRLTEDHLIERRDRAQSPT